jgi:hypothetical protein
MTAIYSTPITTTPWRVAGNASPAVNADPALVVEGLTDIDVDTMADLILQDIGAVELSKLLRYDSFENMQVAYSPVSSQNRMLSYRANSLIGQENSLLTANGTSALSTTNYIDGEINRGYELGYTPSEFDVEIQVAISGDVVPFNTSQGEVLEVV